MQIVLHLEVYHRKSIKYKEKNKILKLPKERHNLQRNDTNSYSKILSSNSIWQEDNKVVALKC